MADWLRGPLREVYREKVIGRTELVGLSLDSSAAKRLLADHLNGRDFSRSLWALLSLALWEERHFLPVGRTQSENLSNIATIGASA